MFSCAGDESSDNTESDQDVSENIMELDDTFYYDDIEYVEGQYYTAWAAIDGPDNELWITTPESYKGEEEVEIDEFERLHIIPEQTYSKMEDEQEWMLAMVVNDFHVWGKFGDFTGPVEVFYDGAKARTLAQYNVVDGKPDGKVTVYTSNGNKYIDW